jgi:hypothetical protein
MQSWQFLNFLKPEVLKPDVLKPGVLKPDVLKPDVLWVYRTNAAFNAYFEFGGKVIKKRYPKKKESQELLILHTILKGGKQQRNLHFFVGTFATFSTQSAPNSAFFYTVLIC